MTLGERLRERRASLGVQAIVLLNGVDGFGFIVGEVQSEQRLRSVKVATETLAATLKGYPKFTVDCV